MAEAARALLGPDGEPIPSDVIAALRAEVAAPYQGGQRLPFSPSPADGLTPAYMAAIHVAAAQGDSLAAMELAEDIEERDPHYAGVLGTRRRQLVQQPITVHAASDDAEHKQHAELVRDWLGTGTLQQALFDITDAIGKGYSVTEIVWGAQPSTRTGGTMALLPQKLLWRPQRWFEIDWRDGTSIRLREAGGLLPLMPCKFVVHKHPFKSGVVTRSSLARLASWSWMWKAFTLRDWARFCQNYGMPIRVGRYGVEASAGDKQVLWRAVSQIAGDAAAIIPRSMEIEFIEAKGTHDGELYERRCDWLNREISKAVLGQTTTTDAVRGGHAVSQEHRLVQEDIERSDCMMVGWTLTAQVIELIVSFNFGPQDAYPRLQLGQLDQVPLADVISGVADLAGAGLAVKATQIRERLGLDDPEAGDETIGGKPPVPDVTRPPITPPKDPLSANMRGALLRDLVSLHAEQAPELVAALSARLAEDAQGALAGMTDAVRSEMEQADSLHDLAERLSRLALPEGELARAMQRGMALAQIAGQASLIAELHGGRPR